MLKEQFVSSGQWLFRWRSYLPLITVLVILLGLRDAWYINRGEMASLTWEAVCLALSFSGFALRCFIVGTAPIGTSGRNVREQVAFSLNTTGMYSVVRHPLYLANLLMVLGPALYSLSLWALVITVLSSWLFYERIMVAEEAFLQQKFGQQFENWAGRVPAIVPAVKHWQPAQMAFSWRSVLKREYNGFAAVIVLFILLDLYGAWIIRGEITLNSPRQWLLGLALLVWVGLRSMRKHTRLLHVEGR